jgi:hypothetical protein
MHQEAMHLLAVSPTAKSDSDSLAAIFWKKMTH